MSAGSTRAMRKTTVTGGVSLIAATILFALVFSYLAKTFDYPAILDRPADEVLPRLLSLGERGRAVWAVYGLIPWLLVPAALGIRAAGQDAAPGAVQVVVITSVLAAACMSAGLLRWPSLHWQLAEAQATGTPAARDAAAVVFTATNSYLGNYVGEFLGELFLNICFLCSSVALVRATRTGRRWFLYLASFAAVLGVLSMFRNTTPVLAPIAALNNVVLPLWMLALGVTLVVHRADGLPSGERASLR